MEDESHSQTEKEKWTDHMESLHIESAIMNRLVMDYLVTEGFKEVQFMCFCASNNMNNFISEVV